MEVTKDNLSWAIKKLLRFRSWPDFPQEAEGVNGRARAFLRLVHNKTVREILEPRAIAVGRPVESIDWKIDPETNDADWILDLVEETLERFPLPAQMRALYSDKLPPASTFGEARAD